MNRVAVLVLCGFTATLGAQQAAPTFDVASVKPNTGTDLSIPSGPTPPEGINFVNRPLDSIVRNAYGVQSFRLLGLPAWAFDERFDINARASRSINNDERKAMLRSLLTDRFGLKAHFETRDQPVYVMTRIRTDAPGLKPRPECVGLTVCDGGGSAYPAAGRLNIRAIAVDQLAAGMLSDLVGVVVRNESGLDGVFDVELSWRPDTAGLDDARPSFFTAVEEQLGLKLTSRRRPVEVLVVERIERPTPD